MDALSISPSFPGTCGQVIKIFSITSLICLTASVIIKWHELTVCFQREGVVVISALLYWIIRGMSGLTSLLEVLQYLFIFIFAHKLNLEEVEKASECLDANSFLTQMISSGYFFFFGYYLGTILALVSLLIVFLCYKIYYRLFVVRRLERIRSIRGSEFNELERIKFSAEVLSEQSQPTCSICLVDFENMEKIIKLPICNHLFHQNCLKEWLKSRRDCPYCRADIKNNQRLLKDSHTGASNEITSYNSMNRNISNLDIREPQERNNQSLSLELMAN